MRKTQSCSARAQSDLAAATVADIFNTFSSGGDSSLISCDVDPAFLASFKLLDKKDPITRSRALQEFNAKHLADKSSEEVKGTFPHFLEYFRKGAILDPDWKCRFLYYTALRKLCEILGRDVEKNLKDFVPQTLVSMFEASNKDVNTAAKRVLETLFPDSVKRGKVVSHFLTPTVDLIDNYLSSTPDALSRQYKSSETFEDLSFDNNERYERVIVASLGCLEYLMSSAEGEKLERLFLLKPWKFLTSSTPAQNPQILSASMHITGYILERWPEAIAAGDLQMIGSCLPEVLSPEMKEGWRLVARISKSSRVDSKKLTKLFNSVELRNLTVEMIEAIAEVRLDAKIFFVKLKSSMELDVRLRPRYIDIMRALTSACIKVDPSTLNEVLSTIRADDVLRQHVWETLAGLSFDCPILIDPSATGYGMAALLVEQNIIAPIEVLEQQLVECGDVREIGFYAKYSKSCRLDILKIIENSDNRNSDVFLETISCLIQRASDSSVIDSVQQKLTFAEFVRLVMLRDAWTSELSAGRLTLTTDALVSSAQNRSALIQAAEFDKVVEVSANGTVDNGLLLIGSDDYNALLSSIFTTPDLEDFAHDLVSVAAAKRLSSGIEGYLNNDLASLWFKRDMSQANPVVSLVGSSETLRKRFINIFTANCSECDQSLLELLFVEENDIESVIDTDMQSYNLLALADYPFLEKMLLSEKFVRFILRMAVVYPEDDRISHVISRWSQLRTPELNPIMSALVESPSQFSLYAVLKPLLLNREKNSDDDITSLVNKCFALNSDWGWFVLRQLVSSFHIPLVLSNELVDSLVNKIAQLSNFQKALLVALEAGYAITAEPSLPPSPFRAEEEVFAAVQLVYLENTGKRSGMRYEFTYVDIREVAEILIRMGNPSACESACRRYLELEDADSDKIDTTILKFLEATGSIEWALSCLDSQALMESGLNRFSLFDVPDFFTNAAIFNRMRAHESPIEQVVRVKLWNVVLEKFVSIKASTFCFLFEFIDEAASDPELTENVKSEFWRIGLHAFEIIQQAEKYSEENELFQYMYQDALRLLSLLLQSAAPGDIHDWASANQNLVSERTIVEHGISGELIQKAVSENKFKNDSLRSNFSLSSKMLVNNYSSHEGEIQAELSVRFPECWPLRLGTVEVSPVVGLSKGKNARLKISIQSVFRMNGVQNAVQIWIENIEGFLKDVEECYICYSVTYHHGTKGTGTGTGAGGSIPNKQCKTCKNKFHSECLLKFFRTSGKTICCLCQNPF